MNGKYGKNQWKIHALTAVGILFLIAIVIGAGAGIVSWVRPRVLAFQEELKKQGTEDQEPDQVPDETVADLLTPLTEATDGQDEEDTSELFSDYANTDDTDPDDEEQEAEKKKAAKKKKAEKKKKAKNSYLIADSNIRYLSESDVEELSLKKINYAKNEIYARRGRRFRSTELQEYFDKKSWYHGTIEPDDFDESVFNEYEKANARFLSAVEHEIDANGYQPG